MIKRVLLVLLVLFSFSVAAYGQTTSVSGTISDSAGQTLNNGTFTFTLIPPTGNNGPFYLAGTLMTPGQLTIKGTLSSGGAFAGVVVGSNASITPVGTTWSFTVCPQATSPCYTQNNITIAGSSQSLTSTVIPPPIQVQAASDVIPTAYSDTEIVGATLGSLYWNSISSTLRICSTFAGGVCSWTGAGSGGTVTAVTGTSPIVSSGGSTPAISCPTCSTSSGTVTSVTGTVNQIDVATGTTTPVVSLDPAIILPGTLTVPSGASLGPSGTGTITATSCSGCASPAATVVYVPSSATIGTAINAAIATCPSSVDCIVQVGNGNSTIDTGHEITVPNNVVLQGQGPSTVLAYGSTGTAITVSGTGAQVRRPDRRLRFRCLRLCD